MRITIEILPNAMRLKGDCHPEFVNWLKENVPPGYRIYNPADGWTLRIMNEIQARAASMHFCKIVYEKIPDFFDEVKIVDDRSFMDKQVRWDYWRAGKEYAEQTKRRAEEAGRWFYEETRRREQERKEWEELRRQMRERERAEREAWERKARERSRRMEEEAFREAGEWEKYYKGTEGFDFDAFRKFMDGMYGRTKNQSSHTEERKQQQRRTYSSVHEERRAKILRSFQILDVTEDTAFEVITKAWKRKAFEVHPDRHPDKRKEMEEKVKDVNEAYQTLKQYYGR